MRSNRGIPPAALSLIGLLVFAAPGGSTLADELGGVEDALEGFDEVEEEPFRVVEDDEVPPPGADARSWDLDGSVSLASSVNYLDHRSATGTDYTGLQKLRSRLNLRLDVDLRGSWQARLEGYGFYDLAYRIQGRGDYTSEVLDEYEWEIDSQDMYVRGELLEDLDLKFGRQIVNWGRSDTIRVLDVLNPLDNREPGLVDIEDIRLPIGMVRLDYYVGPWSLTAIALPEIRFDKLPPVGSDFFPSASPLPPERKPCASLDNTEWAAAAMGIFEHWDVSFHFARYWNDESHIALDSLSPQGLPRLVREHSRLVLVGAGGNYTLGSWLLKGEIAYIDGNDYTVVERTVRTPVGPVPVPSTVERSRLDALVGVEYYGIADTSVALEVANRHIDGFDDRMREFEGLRNSPEGALRITSDFLNARLHTTALGVIFGERAQNGSLVRLQADYDLRDAVVATLGLLLFQNGDPLVVSEIDDNDRVFFEMKYSF